MREVITLIAVLAMRSLEAAGVTFEEFAVSTVGGSQYCPQITSDGAGGAIITWLDERGVTRDIYAQRVDADGNIVWGLNDAGDPNHGVAICTGPGSDYVVVIVSDGAGGAIMTWQGDPDPNTSSDIWAQRVDADGNLRWHPDPNAGSPDPNAPVRICAAPGSQLLPRIASDGAGGALITWRDSRTGAFDVYAQRIDPNGNVLWMTDGVAICTEVGDQVLPTVASDGAGGAIITWEDRRTGVDTPDIYAQRIDASGQVLWEPNGVPICTATAHQGYPELVSDSAGGAIITWGDDRDGIEDIYAQRIHGNGQVLWEPNGVAICTAPRGQGRPLDICALPPDRAHREPASDGACGAIITWCDYRDGETNNFDIYAQKVDSDGNLLWDPDPNNGEPDPNECIPICRAPGLQSMPRLASDGTGGAIITWYDERTGDADTYAQRVDANGHVLWEPDGKAICTAEADQFYPEPIFASPERAMITWYDNRTSPQSDIYVALQCQRTLTIRIVNPLWGYVNRSDPNDLDPNTPAYQYPCGTLLELAAVPMQGKRFDSWRFYDPNHPGDANYVDANDNDSNNPLLITMDTHHDIEAVFKCGSGRALLLVTMLGLLGVFVCLRRRT